MLKKAEFKFIEGDLHVNYHIQGSGGSGGRVKRNGASLDKFKADINTYLDGWSNGTEHSVTLGSAPKIKRYRRDQWGRSAD